MLGEVLQDAQVRVHAQLAGDGDHEGVRLQQGGVLLQLFDELVRFVGVGASEGGLAGAGYALFASARWVVGLAETWKGRGMPSWPRWRR